ncbi:Solute carrier organic anion transporter family member 5A1-like protein [Dinothrombium tinctorium]|uniref:Solute carrier organic anion transporter family member 5A1-like protein n=1 Tax=Dinothrombium tinctorium TaxID=1965070 RepID=A0A443RL40_9ACAR|nr:Solute carrier organic anion transporter family member 5A1-like protein [Dinothrombium tinctorium]
MEPDLHLSRNSIDCEEILNEIECEKTKPECGIFNFKPKWMQKFANPKVFLLNLAIVSILQGSYLPYLVGCLTTLEKRFEYDGKLTGFILIADNLSSLFISPIFGYLGSRVNRARLLASGMIIVAFSLFLTASPFFIYGPAIDLLSKNKTFTRKMSFETCTEQRISDNNNCNGEGSTVWPAFALIWFASFLNGVGYTAFYTLSFPFIDDNVSKQNAPVYISTISTIRLLGPSFGFFCSSLCLKLYENPWMSPPIDIQDPRWIGSWWLEVKKALVRMIKNPLLFCNTLSNCFRWMAYGGYYITQPKYMEAYYRQSASSASFVTGSSSVISMAIGIMGGGLLIRWFKPNPKKLTATIFCLELVGNISIFYVMFLGCPQTDFYGYQAREAKVLLNSECNFNCNCTQKIYQPFCEADGSRNFFSPCHAGCSAFDDSIIDNYNVTRFSNCSCSSSQTISKGVCPTDCNSFLSYVIILSLGKFIGSLARSGNILIELRSVEQRDKNLMMGVIETFLSLFCFIPYPLIYGAIADTSCLIWEENCDKKGNCWVYDNDKFRYNLHSITFALACLGSCFDVGTIFFSKRIKDLYDDGNKVVCELKTLQEKKSEEAESLVTNHK